MFGPDRATSLAADLATVDDRAAAERQAQREGLQRRIADIARRQATLLRQAQDITDPDDPWATGLRGSYNDLDAEKTATLAAVTDLDTADTAEPAPPNPGDVTLLDRLPYLRLNLTQAPEPLLRALFEATRLTITMHEHSDEVTITVTLPADDLPTITDTARNLPPAEHPTHDADQDEPAQPVFVDAVRAPGEAPSASATRAQRRELLVSEQVPIVMRRR